jgi:ABC-type amino acid transport substrate-binding protein
MKSALKIVLLLFSSFLASPSFAVELNGHILDLWPFGYEDKVDNTAKGKYPKLVRAIEAKTNIRLNFNITPLKRVDKYLTAGKTDFSILFLSESFADKVDIVTNIEDLSWYLLYGAGVQSHIDEHTKVGVILGEEATAKAYFKKRGMEKVRLVTSKNHLRLFSMLQRKRIDVAFYVGDGFEQYLDMEGKYREEFGVKELLAERSVYFLLNKTSPLNTPAISNQIRVAIKQLQSSGELKQLFAKSYQY